MAVHCLLVLGVLEGRVRGNSLWKVVPFGEEARNKGVKVCSQSEFWKFSPGVPGRRLHPGVAGEGQSIEKAEEVMREKR